MSQEVELKFLLEPDSAPQIKAFLQSISENKPESLSLINRYFDTDDLKLQSQKVALRIRQKKDKYLQTFKTKGESTGGLHKRLEWEWPIESLSLDKALLEGTGHFPEGVGVDSLSPLFETNFNRYAYDVVYDGILMEVAVDMGEILAKGRTRPLYEVELELRQDSTPEAVEALFRLAAAVAEAGEVFPSDISKGEKGYYLAGCYPLDMIPIPGGALSSRQSLQEMFQFWIKARDYFALTKDPSYQSMAEKYGKELSETVTLAAGLDDVQRSTIIEGLSEGKNAGLAAVALMTFFVENEKRKAE